MYFLAGVHVRDWLLHFVLRKALPSNSSVSSSLKWHVVSVNFTSLVTSCLVLQEEEEQQAAYPMSFTLASHMAASVVINSVIPSKGVIPYFPLNVQACCIVFPCTRTTSWLHLTIIIVSHHLCICVPKELSLVSVCRLLACSLRPSGNANANQTM